MKFKKLLIIPLICLLLCGCTSGEVQEKIYLRCLSVSGNDIKSVSMNFYNKDSVPSKAKEKSFDEILNKIEVLNGKSVFTGHTEVIVLGECNYTATLQFLMEEWKVSPSCLVVYGGNYCDKIIENADSEKLANVLRTAVKQKIIPENDIITVLGNLLQNGETEIPKFSSDGNLGKIKIGK